MLQDLGLDVDVVYTKFGQS